MHRTKQQLLTKKIFLLSSQARNPNPPFNSCRLVQCKQFSRPSSSLQNTHKDVIVSGIQPTGKPHLGNYLGAIQLWAGLQDKVPSDCKLIYSIVDLHAITTVQDPTKLRKWKRETVASLLAVGIDPSRCTIFYQSAVHAHAELMWILSCGASVGMLSRMTQWKSKLSYAHFDEPLYGNHRSKLKLGLFSYPVLQASDILVHRGTQVPVGDDQSQHLEFARDCAKTFNHQYTKVFPEPSTLLSPARRIMSLKEPNLKMSKSHRNPKSRILITDSDEEIYNNIKQALTDSISGVSYDPENRPGVSNLLDIMAYLESGSTSPYELAANFKELSMREFKERVAECVIANLSGIRARFQQIIAADEGRYVDHVAAEGAKKAHESAEATMVLVRDATGL